MLVDFEAFRRALERAVPRSDRARGGRPPYDQVLMFRAVIPRASHSPSDERAGYLVKDRLSLMRCLGLTPAYRFLVFNPGIWWIGLSLNRSGSEVQHLQMNS